MTIQRFSMCKFFTYCPGWQKIQHTILQFRCHYLCRLRVNSKRATQFRQWATPVLREFAIKGYILDKKRLENGSFLGEDYFEHLLSEIREIRLSERCFYQKIADIYATSVDYNKEAPTTRDFFAKVQNKLHYAVHGQTTAELIKQRADGSKKNNFFSLGLVRK